jgi:hypothetical protein
MASTARSISGSSFFDTPLPGARSSTNQGTMSPASGPSQARVTSSSRIGVVASEVVA